MEWVFGIILFNFILLQEHWFSKYYIVLIREALDGRAENFTMRLKFLDILFT